MGTRVTFDGAPPAGTINLGVGQPSADLLPTELLSRASAAFHAASEPFEFNYGEIAGDRRFLETLAKFLTTEYAAPCSPSELMVTGGNSQALDLVCTVFTRAGDTVFVEEPSYFLAFQVFRDHGLNIVGIPTDAGGIVIEALEAALEQHSPALLYTIPSYHNPTGSCMSLARRERLTVLSAERNFVIAADEVYQLLYYRDAPPVAMGTMTGGGNIISMGSFSKILAPGLRLGWIQTSERLQEQLLSAGFVNSGGSISHFASHVVRQAIENGSQTTHLQSLRSAYRSRVAAMQAALHVHIGSRAHWQCPTGGYFFWVELSDDVDTADFRDKARKAEAGFQPGRVFSSRGELRNCLRLSFAHYSASDIGEGLRRLGRVFASSGTLGGA